MHVHANFMRFECTFIDAARIACMRRRMLRGPNVIVAVHCIYLWPIFFECPKMRGWVSVSMMVNGSGNLYEPHNHVDSIDLRYKIILCA